MKTATELWQWLKDQGIDFAIGVPCSWLAPLIDLADNDVDVSYTPAPREDLAIGVAVGAWLGGKKPVVFMSGDGLAASVNVLDSLVSLYDIPLTLVLSQRCSPIQHEWIGTNLDKLLDLLGISTTYIDKSFSSNNIGSRLTAIVARESL